MVKVTLTPAQAATIVGEPAFEVELPDGSCFLARPGRGLTRPPGESVPAEVLRAIADAPDEDPAAMPGTAEVLERMRRLKVVP